MPRLPRTLLPILFLAVVPAAASQVSSEAPAENQCILCHANPDVWEKETLRLFVTPADLASDIHWQKGLRCNDCHGGNPNTTNLREAHAAEDGFQTITKPDELPAFCGRCHSDPKRVSPGAKTDQVARFWESVHGKHLKQFGGDKASAEAAKSASCLACHPKHKTLPASDPASSIHPRHLVETCGHCHPDQRTALRKGVHHAAGERNELDVGTPLDCLKCHGREVHGMLAVRDPQSPVRLESQVQTCGECHKKDLGTYVAGIHGRGLYESGLTISAVCADCHGAHDIYYAADKRSRLHATNVAGTCGKCHRFIDQRLEQSVHGSGTGTGEAASGTGAKPLARGRSVRKPGCSDCHQGHDAARPDTAAFRLQLPNRCGNCHADFSLRYGLSMHGRLTHLGYEPAANCSDCHGAHDILRLNDPHSRLSLEPVRDPQTGATVIPRVLTCQKCHPHAVPNFAAFDPHANHKDPVHYSELSQIFETIETVLYLLFGLWILHAILWFARSLIHTLRYGRHKRLVAEEYAIIRFAPIHRVTYVLIVVGLLGLMFTGLPLEYSSQPWAQRLARSLGGFGSTSVWHHSFGAMLLVAGGLHLVWGLGRLLARWQAAPDWRTFLFGPDSPVPNRRDLRDIVAMFRWFFGLGAKPVFERWTYWEKFDYWAVCLMFLMLGSSGLVLWVPNIFCLVFPGWLLNVAKVIHTDTALLVGSLVLIVHFFNMHFRPEKFPMDLSLVTGLVSEDHLRFARPEFLERLEREGQLEALRVTVPPRRKLRPVILGGIAVFTVGTILLLSVLLAALSK